MANEIFNCPACGGKLNNPGDAEFIKCNFCGNTIRIKVRKPKSLEEMRTTFVDKATGMTLGSVLLPEGFKTNCMVVPNVSTYAYPIPVSCSAFDSNGTLASFFIGEGFVDRSKCPMLSGPFSEVVNSINKVAYVNFKDGDTYLDDYIGHFSKTAQPGTLRFKGYMPMPIDGFDQAKELEYFKREVDFDRSKNPESGMAPILGYYLCPMCKAYEMVVGDIKFNVAVATVIKGFKYQIPAMYSAPSIGGLLGGLFGHSKESAPASNARPGSFGDMPMNAVIDWKSDGIFFFQTREENFEKEFANFFKMFCSTFRLDPEILKRSEQMKYEIDMKVANATQQNIAQQQRSFQAMQQANATLQAAYDSANQAWWDRNNSSWAASRSRAYAGESSSDRISRLQSEAIRGVNTYVRDDGTEVEVSVDYDRAFSNATHDTVATNSTFAQPSGGWYEMNRK